MPRAMRTARTTLLALAVTGALGFGASAAMAEARRGPILESAQECQQYCAARWYPNYNWNPTTGNCTCLR
jgi:hypothetical protein